ncbi:MAG: cupin domain-containing protein [Cytophagales bacterium]
MHPNHDETFIVIEGEFDFEVDGKILKANAGDIAFVPKGSIHAWKNVGKTIGKLNYIFSPGSNIENLFREFAEANKNDALTPSKLIEISKKYPDQQIVGPPM